MDIDQYFALHTSAADTKVAHKTWKEQEKRCTWMLEEMLEKGHEGLTRDELREALIMMHKTHTAHVNAIAALFMHERPRG